MLAERQEQEEQRHRQATEREQRMLRRQGAATPQNLPAIPEAERAWDREGEEPEEEPDAEVERLLQPDDDEEEEEDITPREEDLLLADDKGAGADPESSEAPEHPGAEPDASAASESEGFVTPTQSSDDEDL